MNSKTIAYRRVKQIAPYLDMTILQIKSQWRDSNATYWESILAKHDINIARARMTLEQRALHRDILIDAHCRKLDYISSLTVFRDSKYHI